MGQQKVKEKGEEKAEAKEAPKAPREEKGQPKKWKGKDWFVILAPKIFNEMQLAETPTTDPAMLVGRNVEIAVSDLLGQPGKYYMKVFFKITDVDSRNAYTRFNGYSTTREYLYRVVRKRLQKVESVNVFDTRDGWKLQITSIAVLNRNSDSEIQKKVRHIMVSHISEVAKKSAIDDILKKVIEGSLQKEIRKLGNKIYPIRFCEIAKIEVMKAPEK